MNTETQKIFEVLFSTLPPSGGTEPESVAKQLAAYSVAVEGHDPRDVQKAVSRFLRGEVPGYNPKWAPTAPELGTQVKRARDERHDSEKRSKPPALPAPEIERTPESRERVRAKMAEAISVLAAQMRTDEAKSAAEAKRKAEFEQRYRERFRPDQAPKAMASRLGIEIGDPDAESGAWGEMGAA